MSSIANASIPFTPYGPTGGPQADPSAVPRTAAVQDPFAPQNLGTYYVPQVTPDQQNTLHTQLAIRENHPIASALFGGLSGLALGALLAGGGSGSAAGGGLGALLGAAATIAANHHKLTQSGQLLDMGVQQHNQQAMMNNQLFQDNANQSVKHIAELLQDPTLAQAVDPLDISGATSLDQIAARTKQKEAEIAQAYLREGNYTGYKRMMDALSVGSKTAPTSGTTIQNTSSVGAPVLGTGNTPNAPQTPPQPITQSQDANTSGMLRTGVQTTGIVPQPPVQPPPETIPGSELYSWKSSLTPDQLSQVTTAGAGLGKSMYENLQSQGKARESNALAKLNEIRAPLERQHVQAEIQELISRAHFYDRSPQGKNEAASLVIRAQQLGKIQDLYDHKMITHGDYATGLVDPSALSLMTIQPEGYYATHPEPPPGPIKKQGKSTRTIPVGL